MDCLAALSATGPTCARNSFSCRRVSLSMACFNDSHFTALTSSIGSRAGPPTACICQNWTILIRPSTAYNIEPRNPWTETACPVSSKTSRLAAASARSPGLSLPFGRTQDLSLRNRTIAMRGLEPSRKTIPPAARTGALLSAESFMSMPCRTNAREAIGYLESASQATHRHDHGLPVHSGNSEPVRAWRFHLIVSAANPGSLYLTRG
jgi:hypothetical protein